MKKYFIAAVLLSLNNPIYGLTLDAHQAVKELLGFSGLPRPLNTIDFPERTLPSAQTLLAPEGDFNADGKRDIAVSGVFDNPDGAPYFFLLATFNQSKKKYERLYWSTAAQPFLIHLPGTTGEGDPGNQALSYSFCTECANGFDLFWNDKKGEFNTTAWKTRRVAVPAPLPEEISEKEIDQALQIAGVIPEIQNFVSTMKPEEGRLSTRVTKEDGVLWVWILQKGEREKLFFRVQIDLIKNKAVRIERENGRLITAPE